MDHFFRNIPSKEPRIKTGRKKEKERKTDKKVDRKTDTVVW